jgi:hypothetical protein
MQEHDEHPVKMLTTGGEIPPGPARRGPKTAAGKARVRFNAVRHGLGVTSPVIPGVENPEDWEAHRAAMLASLAPGGYLETVLAERVALVAWRLRRIPRYEVACVVTKGSDGSMDDEADRLLPYPEDTGRVILYEAHLSREFYRALHALGAQQARRHGQPAPLARVDIQGIPEA